MIEGDRLLKDDGLVDDMQNLSPTSINQYQNTVSALRIRVRNLSFLKKIVSETLDNDL